MENRRSQTTTQSTQTNSDVTTWALPEGATGRLGRGAIADLAFSPDGESLAVATTLGCWIYELTTMKPIALWETERGLVSTISFSPNGQWIATSNWDGIIKVWEAETQRCTTKIQGWHRRTSELAFSPDSQYLAASGKDYGDVYVWCAKTGQHVASFKMEGKREEDEQPPARFPICFSPDGQLLAYFTDWSTLTVRDLKTKECFASLDPKPHLRESGHVYDLAFSPCRQFLAASLQDSTTRENIAVQVWDIDKETLETTYTNYSGIRVLLAYSPDSTLRVADVYEDKVVMWDASRGEKLDTIEYQGKGRTEQCISTDGQQFAILTERDIRVWRAGSPATTAPLTVPHQVPESLFFYQSGKRLACKYWFEDIVFWDVVQKQGVPPPISSKGVGKRCALSACEELLALNGEDGQTLEVWNITSGARIVELTEHQSFITTVVFSPSGEHLISGDVDGKLIV